jgi:NADH-quinone oxidoreductase subunit N
MLLVMFGLAGVPPTVGFWAKVQVIAAVLDVDMTWLAALAVLVSVIGAYYYLRIVKLMYFDEPTTAAPVEAKIAVRFMLSVNGLAILVLGLYPGMLLKLCEHVLP